MHIPIFQILKCDDTEASLYAYRILTVLLEIRRLCSFQILPAAFFIFSEPSRYTTKFGVEICDGKNLKVLSALRNIYS